MSQPEKPILFHYPQSIYSHRVLWYLWLRGIPYDECIQPAYLPRPDLAQISVNYRRIPILAIGQDVYCDSRLIIRTLESRYPGSNNNNLTPPTPADAGIKSLFESWGIDGGLFSNAVKLIPYNTPTSLLTDTKFLDDRQQLMGGKRFSAEEREAARPDGTTHMRQAFATLENTFLADGRDWILGTNGPTTADIDAVWPFEWIIADRGMKGALEGSGISEERFPKVFGYVRRFLDVVKMAREHGPKPTRLDRGKMRERIMGSKKAAEGAIIADDPLGLERGDEVEVYPSDYGMSHKDRGTLVGLSLDEVTIKNSLDLHLHFPRWNFKIVKLQPSLKLGLTPSSIRKYPSMRLIYHPASPYTRKVFMTALEHDLTSYITLQKVVVCPIPFPGWSDNNEDVAVYNPMAKIPCLVPEDVPEGIFDSRIICEYLEELKRASKKKNWHLRTLHACADGIMDAGVLLAYERRIRKPLRLDLDSWIDGQKLKMRRGLDRFEVAAGSDILPDPPSGPASADEIAVVCAVEFAERMNIDWKNGRPKLQNWYGKWGTRKSFVETPMDQDWKAAGLEIWNGSTIDKKVFSKI